MKTNHLHDLHIDWPLFLSHIGAHCLFVGLVDFLATTMTLFEMKIVLRLRQFFDFFVWYKPESMFDLNEYRSSSVVVIKQTNKQINKYFT